MSELLAIFDVDGTLSDSQGVIHTTMSRAFEAAGLVPPDREAVISRVGLSLPRMVSELLGEASDRTEDVIASYRLGYLASMEAGEEPPLFPGVDAGLRRLQDMGVVLGVATGKSQRGIDRLIESQGWGDLFATVQCADFHPSKPDPAMLRRALLETATEPADAIMIGDTSYDMEMARRAGVATLGVDWGYHSADRLRDSGAGAVVSSFEALVARIEGMVG